MSGRADPPVARIEHAEAAAPSPRRLVAWGWLGPCLLLLAAVPIAQYAAARWQEARLAVPLFSDPPTREEVLWSRLHLWLPLAAVAALCVTFIVAINARVRPPSRKVVTRSWVLAAAFIAGVLCFLLSGWLDFFHAAARD